VVVFGLVGTEGAVAHAAVASRSSSLATLPFWVKNMSPMADGWLCRQRFRLLEGEAGSGIWQQVGDVVWGWETEEWQVLHACIT
jgi:hypothetical protein